MGLNSYNFFIDILEPLILYFKRFSIIPGQIDADTIMLRMKTNIIPAIISTSVYNGIALPLFFQQRQCKEYHIYHNWWCNACYQAVLASLSFHLSCSFSWVKNWSLLRSSSLPWMPLQAQVLLWSHGQKDTVFPPQGVYRYCCIQMPRKDSADLAHGQFA